MKRLWYDAKVGSARRRLRTWLALCLRYVRAMSAVDRIGTVVQSTRSGKQCAEYFWGMQLQMPYNGGFKVVMGCEWWRCVFGGTQLQIARRLITVASRWSWVASGGAVFLGNAIAD